MKTDKTLKAEAIIRAKIAQKLPAFGAAMKDNWCGAIKVTGAASEAHINVQVSHPRDYMGRFDAGKKYWTIDLKENIKYSRTKQVRVKIVDGEPQFDENKLKQYITDLSKIILEERSKKEKIEETMALINSKGVEGLFVEFINPTYFEVNYCLDCSTVEEVNKFIKFIKTYDAARKD